MSKGTEYLLGFACVVVIVIGITGAVLYTKANTASGCFLGYCGAVIKTP